MKQGRRKTEEISHILRDSEGLTIDETCRKHGEASLAQFAYDLLVAKSSILFRHLYLHPDAMCLERGALRSNSHRRLIEVP